MGHLQEPTVHKTEVTGKQADENTREMCHTFGFDLSQYVSGHNL